MSKGGVRKGSGRKLGSGIPGLKMRSIRLTDEEYDLLRQYLKKIRKAKKDAMADFYNRLKEQQECQKRFQREQQMNLEGKKDSN